MTALLYTLLQITVGSALTAAAILLVRLIFHRWLSAKAKYYLWLLLALRLCLPVLPGSPFSVLNWIPQPGIVLAEDSESARLAVNPSVGAIYAEENMPSEPGFQAIVSPSDAEAISAQNAPAGNPLSHNDVIFLIWLVGVGITLSAQGVLYIITGIKLRRLPLCDDSETLHCFRATKRSLGYHGSAKLVCGAQGMSGGLFRPVIVIPAEVCGEAAAPILIHELKHIQSGDLWLLAFYRLLCGMHWFNPISWLSFRQLKRDCEAANDQRVLESGLITPVDYATTLFAEGIAGMVYGTTHFGGSDHDIRNRIRMISAFKKPAIWMAVLAVILGVLVCASTLTRAQTENREDIRNALIGAENTFFEIGKYVSETGNTASLSEEDLQSQIDTFNQNMERYYAADCVYMHELSGEESNMSQPEYNEYLLREVFLDTTQMSYYVSGGTFGCNVEKLRVKDHTAIITAELARYTTRIELNEDKKYHILSRAVLYHKTANMVLEDGRWKVLSYEPQEGEWWDSERALSDSSVAYDSFAEALAVAKAIDVSNENPFNLRSWDWVLETHEDENVPAHLLPSASTLASAIEKYDAGIGVFGDSFEETLAAGYLAPESCVVTEQTEISTVYETEIELLGETTEATYVFSATQFTESEDGRQVLTEIHVRIPTSRSGDKTAWIQEIGTWHNDMYGGVAVDFYASPETVSDFLTETQQEFVRKRLLESDMAENEAAAEEYLQNWELALYYVQYDELIFNGTGLALCRTCES